MLAILALSCVLAPLAQAGRTPVYNDPPSYDGRDTAPKTRSQTPPLPDPVTLSAAGLGPHAVVDDAGTAHIAWAEGGDQDGLADRVIYCRMKRAAKACDANATLRAGAESPYNTDYFGPEIVRVGEQLVIFSKRYPAVVEKPDGGSSSTVFAWTSNDGGSSWNEPAIVGKRDIADIVVMQSENDPTILAFGQDPFCGMCLTAYKSGQYSPDSANLGVRPNDAYYPQIELENNLPVVSWVNLDGTTTIRRWSGQGSVTDPLTWSLPLNLPNSNETDLAGGPGGTQIVSTKSEVRRFQVRSVGQSGFGRATNLTPPPDKSSPIFATAEQDPAGRLLFAYSDRNDFTKRDGLWLRSAAGEQRLSRGVANGQIDIAATTDGGGFTVFNHTGGIVNHGEIVAAGFGNQAPTNAPGLADVPGGGDKNTTCQQVKFGSFSADTAAGCFLKGTGQNSSLVVTGGEINLHGLRIIPEGSSKIILDPKTLRLDTTGAVRVVVSSGLTGEIVLWRGELHRDLSAVKPGTNLFDFPIGEYATNILGFDVGANVSVRLEKDGVHIPVSLKLPPAFGGFSGDAELIATKEKGLILDSLHIELGPIPLGALIINKVELDYTGGEEEIWRGAGSITVPAGGTLDASVEFKGGGFNGATMSFTPATPIPIGPFVYLLQIGGGFTVDPVHIEASARLGAGFAAGGTSPVNINGKFEMDFPKNGPGNFKLSGTVSVFFLEVGNGFLQFQTDGYAAFGGQVGPLSLGPLNLEASVGGFVDAGTGDFGANLDGKVELCVDFEVVAPCASAGANVALSNVGFAACAGFEVLGEDVTGGVKFPWNDFTPEILFNPFLATVALIEHVAIPCNTNGYKKEAPRASASQAGSQVVTVPAGVPTFTVLLKGDGGPPDVTATGPDGTVVRTAQPSAKGYGASVAGLPARYLVLNKPAAGNWTITPDAGSPAITDTMVSEGFKAMTVKGSVGGKGRKRRVNYRLSNRGNGQRVVFLEKGAFGTNIVGSTDKARGTLRYTIADAKGGKRRVIAQVQTDGLVTSQKTLGSYRAPGPQRPGKVKRLRAKRKAKSVTVSWRPAKGANRYAVTLRGKQGTSLGRFVGRKARKVRFNHVRPDERLTITVVATSKKLRSGPRATARLKPSRR